MPQYAGPIAMLRPDDVLTFACPVCGHQSSMEARRLTERVSSDILVEDVDARLRCTRCGARGEAQLIAIDAADE